MLKQKLLNEIDFQKEWEKTLFYKVFKVKKPSKGWKVQLIRINKRHQKKHLNIK